MTDPVERLAELQIKAAEIRNQITGAANAGSARAPDSGKSGER